MNKLITCFFVFGVLWFSNPKNELQAQISEDLVLMSQWMQGNYDVVSHSSSEAKALCIQRIWEDKTNGIWFYVELQNADNSELIEQYIYLASDITYGEFSLDTYIPKKAEKVAGACENPDLLLGLTPFDLSYVDGCSIFLTYDGFQYEGSSNGGTCVVNKTTGEYKVKQFKLTSDELTILEKLYDTTGSQIGDKNGDKMKYSKKK
jgi:hypothetical protein